MLASYEPWMTMGHGLSLSDRAIGPQTVKPLIQICTPATHLFDKMNCGGWRLHPQGLVGRTRGQVTLLNN